MTSAEYVPCRHKPTDLAGDVGTIKLKSDHLVVTMSYGPEFGVYCCHRDRKGKTEDDVGDGELP